MIIYIHGFNSNGNGSKSTELRVMFPDIEIYSPSYDSSDFGSIEQMIDEIDIKIKDEPNTLFIGCSLGGYLAQYLADRFNSKSILLNPCYEPQYFLSKMLGKNIMYHNKKEYELTVSNISLLEKYNIDKNNRKDISISIFTNKDDNIIPYEGVLSYYDNRPVTVFEKGGHRFNNLKDIQENIIKRYFSVL
jgi:uncharacterized protein